MACAPFLAAHATDQGVVAMLMIHEAWTYAKGAYKQCNGRATFLSIFDHKLGPNNVNHMATKAKRKLTTTYNCKKKSWSFKKYVPIHKKQCNILESLKDYGHKEIDECSKAWYLSDGINSIKLDSVKSIILASAAYHQYFDVERCICRLDNIKSGRK